MTSIPLVDLKAQYRAIQPEIDDAIRNVVNSTSFILGEHVTGFEKAFAEFCGTTCCIGVASGTAAVHLALLAAGVGPGDEVITTPFTFIATTEAISNCGARPVFVDVVPGGFHLDATQVERAITEKTKAIVPVHLYGELCDMTPLLAVARKYGLKVVEDAAQAHGAAEDQTCAGAFGDCGCFSFFPGKNLGAYGDAGAVVTNDPDMAARVRLLRDHGRTSKYEHQTIGFCERLDAIHAAVLAVKLRHLDAWNTRRRTLAGLYDVLLPPVVRGPRPRQEQAHVHHLYVARVPDRDAVCDEMKSLGIGVGVHYPCPIHLQPAYAWLGHARHAFPHAEAASREVLSLPLFPELNEDSVHVIAEALAGVLATSAGVSVTDQR